MRRDEASVDPRFGVDPERRSFRLPLTGMIQAGESSDWPTPPMYFEKKDLQLRNIE